MAHSFLSIGAKAFAVALIGAAASSANASLLLSDNSTGWQYPGDVPKLTTGATYTWLAGSDSGCIANDPANAKLTDGIDNNGGGSQKVYANWDNAPATIVFDLKAAYSIEKVGVATEFTSPNGVGLPSIIVSVSSDGSSYSPWASVSNPGVADGKVVLDVVGSAATAQYVKIAFDRQVGGGEWYHQMIIGEAAVFGSPVPEPTVLGGLSALALMLRRRSR